ncbi:MAG: hypothetical protein K1X55_04365 [Chitinophagales bacterium]|nr:hypothetical protein [Chitinophagales bacterium]
MSIAELKLDLINKISQVRENYIIEELQNLIDFELSELNYVTNDVQKLRIEESRLEYKNGNILSELSANAEIEEWLRK